MTIDSPGSVPMCAVGDLVPVVEGELRAELAKALRERDDALRQARREHLVDVPYRHMANLRAWLERPNGSHNIGRVTFEAVEGGGVLVRTLPYSYPEPRFDDLPGMWEQADLAGGQTDTA